MTLTLHTLHGWYYIASIDNGPKFELGYYDVSDYCNQQGIDSIINKSGN